MSTTEPPPATAASATPTPTSTSSPASNLSPVTYVVIPLVTLASVFLVGLFAYFRRRRSRRLENSPDGGESQMQERRHGGGGFGATGGAGHHATDRWPHPSLGMHWWFLRSNEGLNELGEAPPPYDVKRLKAATEGSASATDEDAEDREVNEEEDEQEEEHASEDDESRHSNETIRTSTQSQISETRRGNEEPEQSNDEARLSTEQQSIPSDEQTTQDTTTTQDDSEEQTPQTAPPIQPLAEPSPIPAATTTTAARAYDSDSDGELPLLSRGRRQTPAEIAAIIESRRARHQRRRERALARAAIIALPPDQRGAEICTTEFFRTPSPGRAARRIERTNRRLRRLGYVTSDSSELYGFQLRDMEGGAAPPGYEREPEVVVPPPAVLPTPPEADTPPPYPVMPVRNYREEERRRAERDRVTGPPMVRVNPHEQHLSHHYLFMPPLEHDYLVTSFSASLDMPRHLHSRF